MELLQLRYFFESARTESFAKTAEKYMVPPSSVSITIKRLENELGCQLFDRHGNRVTLNAMGQKLQRALGEVFDKLDRVTSEISLNITESTEIKILVRALRSRITDTVIEYRKTHPHVKFVTSFDFDEVNFGDYDMVITAENGMIEGFTKFEMLHMRLRLQVRADNPLCGRMLTMKQLRNYPFVIMNKKSFAYQTLLKACKNAGFVPNIALEINDEFCYKKCIRKGVGIGCVRERVLSPNENVAYLSVSDFEEREVYYGFCKSHDLNPHLRDFVDFLKYKFYSEEQKWDETYTLD